MTEEEVLQLINDFIVANGNNEITADVLRPILVAILQQPNDYIGDLEQLQTSDQSNLVNAINEVYNMISDSENTGVKLYEGTIDPNATPPAQYNIADFYIQKDLSNNPVDLWQYNGVAWIKQLTIGQIVNDDITSTTSTWSSQKIEDEIGIVSDIDLQTVLDNGSTANSIDNFGVYGSNHGVEIYKTVGVTSAGFFAGNASLYTEVTTDSSFVKILNNTLNAKTLIKTSNSGEIKIESGESTTEIENNFIKVDVNGLTLNTYGASPVIINAKNAITEINGEQANDDGELTLDVGTVTEVTGVTDEITVASGTTTPVIGIATAFKNLFARLSGGNTFSGNQTINGTIISQNAIFTKTDGSPIITGTNANDTDFIIGNTAAGATDKYVFVDSSIPNRALVLNNGSGGNVGIDTPTPQSKLDVNGSVRASSNDGTPTAVVRNEDLEAGYVPLSGTLSGSPITGELQVTEAGRTMFIETSEYENQLSIAESGISLFSKDKTTGFMIGITAEPSTNNISISSDNTATKGIVGELLFNKDDDPNAYPQLGDIQTNITIIPDTTVGLIVVGLEKYYGLTGSGAEASLPPITGYVGKKFIIANKSGGSQDIYSNDGTSNDIWSSGTATNTVSLASGEVVQLFNDGVNWVITTKY